MPDSIKIAGLEFIKTETAKHFYAYEFKAYSNVLTIVFNSENYAKAFVIVSKFGGKEKQEYVCGYNGEDHNEFINNKLSEILITIQKISNENVLNFLKILNDHTYNYSILL